MIRKLRSALTLLTLLLLLTSVSLHAQYSLKQAQDLAKLYNYTAAKPLFIKAYNQKKTIEAARGLAEIYMETKDYVFAESWCTKVVGMAKHTPQDVFRYAEALMNNSKYSEATEQLEIYLSKVPDDKRAENMLEGCNMTQQWLTNPVKGRLENMKGFNSKYSDWGVSRNNGQYVFASDRPYNADGKGTIRGISRDYYGWTGNDYLHLYESNGQDSSSVKELSKSVNGEFHSAKAVYTANGKEMYYAVTNMEKKGTTSFLGKEEPYTLNVGIKYCLWNDTKNAWGTPIEFPYNKRFNYSVGDPWINPTGELLFFTSTSGEGNMGGTDIFYAKKELNGDWGIPYNMGSDINTAGDERTPAFDSEGNFYFSSNGKPGMGGLDIFKAAPGAARDAWIVKNMGSPINSAQDDFAPYFETKEMLYFASDRIDGKGSDDIYRFNLEVVEPTKVVVAKRMLKLEGTIRDEDQQPLKDVVVTLVNKTTNTSEKYITGEDGKYSFTLDPEDDYELNVDRTGYKTIKGIEVGDIDPLTGKKIQNVGMEKIPKIGHAVELKNIYFDLDKSKIRADAAIELNRMAKVLNDNPTWNIEMSSHTDSRANDTYNMALSQRRAEATVEYLITRGVAASRLIAKGYGETKLVNRCGNGVKCSEARHQMNRRTEFTILDR